MAAQCKNLSGRYMTFCTEVSICCMYVNAMLTVFMLFM